MPALMMVPTAGLTTSRVSASVTSVVSAAGTEGAELQVPSLVHLGWHASCQSSNQVLPKFKGFILR